MTYSSSRGLALAVLALEKEKELQVSIKIKQNNMLNVESSNKDYANV